MIIKLFYGMKLRNKAGNYFVIKKYEQDNVDAMRYKVRLSNEFGSQPFYSSDLVNLISAGHFTIM